MNEEYAGIAPMSAEDCLEILNKNANCYGEYLKVKENLKALEIIKKKDVDIYGIKNSIDIYDYNAGIAYEDDDNFENRLLDQEEYDLLKEILI